MLRFQPRELPIGATTVLFRGPIDLRPSFRTVRLFPAKMVTDTALFHECRDINGQRQGM